MVKRPISTKWGNSSNRRILATVNGVKTVVPKDTDNTTYAEAMRQVEEGTLTIADAD